MHEFLGHACTAWLLGVKVILVSSTAMQTAGGSRLIPAAGPLSNLMFGAAAYIVMRRIPGFTALRFFLWIFTFANLFLGFGYILYSGVINFGDSAYVIAGLRPAWMYRAGLIVLGAWGYRFSVGLAARDTASLIRSGSVLSGDIPRLVYPACLAGALLYFIASLFNPVSPSLILYDGLSMAAGVVIGFCLIPGVARNISSRAVVASPNGPENAPASVLPFSPAWLLLAMISTIAFLYFLGRGFRP
ncbi:MAG TPA: hypothetical protein VMJ93_15810 [Verrucomicrobiae bacterium]|nr:hypothetical protein [Verrucomicrobiae bacterium]